VAVTECQPVSCETILKRADAVGAPVLLLGRDFTYSISGDPWQPRFSYDSNSLHLQEVPLGLAGRHQGINAAAATALACLLQPAYPNLNEAAIHDGLSAARWPCRNERVLDSPPVYMDVAHNAAGAAEVAQQYRDCVTILSVSSDKDAAGIIRAVGPVSSLLILTSFAGVRSLPVERLSAAAAGHPHRVVPHLADAIEEGLRLADADHPLLITGSIYAAGEARKVLIERYGAAPVTF
jgi:dihydrofolate synthase/folylpolyglutamate synthase